MPLRVQTTFLRFVWFAWFSGCSMNFLNFSFTFFFQTKNTNVRLLSQIYPRIYTFSMFNGVFHFYGQKSFPYFFSASLKIDSNVFKVLFYRKFMRVYRFKILFQNYFITLSIPNFLLLMSNQSLMSHLNIPFVC